MHYFKKMSSAGTPGGLLRLSCTLIAHHKKILRAPRAYHLTSCAVLQFMNTEGRMRIPDKVIAETREDKCSLFGRLILHSPLLFS